MFTYDDEYTEQDWMYEADARELAELDADRRDMAEYPAPESLVTMENPALKRYLAWGPEFADDAGPIGMEPAASSEPQRKKEAA